MNKEVKEIVANYTSARKTLQKLVPDFTWSELLGDYGEYVCIESYGFRKAPANTKGFDARRREDKKKVQIKTIRDTTKSIKFAKGSDYILVIEVNDKADWREIFYGNSEKVLKASSKHGEYYSIGKAKLKKLAANTYRPPEEINITLDNGKVLSALTRQKLREELEKRGYELPAASTVDQRFRNGWDPERAFGIKVPQNYAEEEKYVDIDGYEWFPEKPTIHGDREPLVFHPQKRVYISHKHFADDKGIPEDYLSDKLQEEWDLSRIIDTYDEIRK